ncbi:MAG TPA: hypothetical protein P5528_11710 [Steroidobacteraceae bacterium]|nr:hypothetical protein [Steroidobacteraceae bacterium]
MSSAYRFLFLPVSAARGTGEYMRALAIAAAVAERWPEADIRFMVSHEAPYAKSVPFRTQLLASSPTMQPRAVAAYLRDFRPHIVVFDNAGRTSQLKVAREVGARVVYVSSRSRQRRRAFRWRWMRLVAEHWIAYPELLAGRITVWERCKLGISRGPRVRYLDVLLPTSAGATDQTVFATHAVAAGQYVLITPGGGAAHRSLPYAAGIISQAARTIAARVPAVLWIGGGQVTASETPASLRRIERLPMTELMTLIRGAAVVLTNGADTLLQVMALERPCVAVALSPDQAVRLQRLQQAGISVDVPLDSDAIVRAALLLYGNADAARDNVAMTARLSLSDGLQTAVAAIEQLLPPTATRMIEEQQRNP